MPSRDRGREIAPPRTEVVSLTSSAGAAPVSGAFLGFLRPVCRGLGESQQTRDWVAERTGFELRHTEATAPEAGTFDWTSPAKRALVVETDRQSDLCSEHAQRPASVPGLWWCKRPIVGIGSGGQGWKSPVTELPVALAASPAPMRIARRRGQLTPWTTPTSMSSAANGDGFIGASRQGSVATC
jgi:hypothetical protein